LPKGKAFPAPKGTGAAYVGLKLRFDALFFLARSQVERRFRDIREISRIAN
jgi:hypothetical protein